MPDLVHQIGELFLRALPVVVIVLVFYFLMRSLFFAPLLKVMDERDARTLGARRSAEAAQAAAEAKMKEYEAALREAKAKVYGEQEAERRKHLEERAAELREARKKAASTVDEAKARVDQDFQAAQKDIEASCQQLAMQIAQRVLPLPPGPAGPARGMQ